MEMAESPLRYILKPCLMGHISKYILLGNELSADSESTQKVEQVQ